MNGEQSRQSRVNREQNDINANNCRTVNSRQFTHNSSLSAVHSLAFTLAETLIVMGIIGVVAALTIPNVNKNTGRAETVTKVKKIYAELSEAHDRATAVYGPINTWPSSCDHKCYRGRILEFMKFQKTCEERENETTENPNNGCTPCNFYNINNTFWDTDVCYCGILLNNGIGLNIDGLDIKCHYDNFTVNDIQNSCGIIHVDIDGPKKGKSIWGNDIFDFAITKNGIKPIGSEEGWNDNEIKNHCFNIGEFCTAWVINTGNMDYLDADENGKCKHSNKTLSTTVSSCK